MHLQDISNKIRENYLYYHRIDNKKVKKTNKKVIKNYNQITENCNQIIQVQNIPTPVIRYNGDIDWGYGIGSITIPIYIDPNQSSPITGLV